MTADAADRRAGWAWVGVVVAVLDTLAVVVSLLVAAASNMHLGINESGSWINLVAAPSFPLLAALMMRTRGRQLDRPPRQDRLARLFLAFGALCAGTLAVHVFAEDGLQNGIPGATGLAWISSWLWVGVPTGLVLGLLWFPTGEEPGPRWRWVTRALTLAFGCIWASVALAPGRMTDFPGRHRNPLGWSALETPLHVVSGVGFLLLGASALATVASVLWRFRCGDADVRAQLRWLVAAVGVLTLTVAVPSPPSLDGLLLALNILTTFLLPVTLAVTLVRRDGLVLPRVLVFGALSITLLASYIGAVALGQAVFGNHADRAATLLAAGLVAVAVAPVRARLQRAVDKLVYGDRGNPHAALSELGRRISGSPHELLHEVVAAVSDALRTGYAAVVLTGDDEPAAAVGRPSAAPVVVPLSLRGEPVGSLLVAPRRTSEPFGARDATLLAELARHIAVAAHAAALTRDLQRSRESLVVAREEERRRIRRDLHDGLGPALAGVALGLEAARRTVVDNPPGAAAALGELKEEVQASIADIRRLVYDLRPPALDQLGLVPAVQQYAARLSEGGALDVSVSAQPLPALPAAVEVAAYRITTEALTNVARHARATHGAVAFEVDGRRLLVAVEDNGVGVPRRRDPGGVGLTAMAERAAELGGSCSIERRSEGGTRVVAILPLKGGS